jgi:hypothetical protein
LPADALRAPLILALIKERAVAQPITFRDHAARCHAEADEATLDNVRERCLRAEAAWLQMADRDESIARARAKRDNDVSITAGEAAEDQASLTEITLGDVA